MFLMWEKKRNQSFVFLATIFSLQITTILSALNFPSLKLKLLITFGIMAVDNFYDDIVNQHRLLVYILKCEGNQRGKISTPTHPHNSRSALGFRANAGPQRRGYSPPPIFFILELRYRPFELKIHIKVDLLKPKIMPNQLLSISKTTFKKSKKRLFWPPKWSKWPSQRAKFWPTFLILEVRYRPFELKIHQKVSLLRPKIMPKQLLNISKTTFRKSKKRVFWPWKWSKWPFQRAKFWHKILILEVRYRPFELKIQLKVGILRPKIMPKQLLNSSKTTFKNPRKRLFWPWKWSKWPSQRANFWLKILILEVIYRPFELEIPLKWAF